MRVVRLALDRQVPSSGHFLAIFKRRNPREKPVPSPGVLMLLSPPTASHCLAQSLVVLQPCSRAAVQRITCAPPPPWPLRRLY